MYNIRCEWSICDMAKPVLFCVGLWVDILYGAIFEIFSIVQLFRGLVLIKVLTQYMKAAHSKVYIMKKCNL